MIRHIVIASLRNMAANRLISAIAIVGLAAGIAAAILMALVVKNQLSFDHFIAGYGRVYLVRSEIRRAGAPLPLHTMGTPAGLAALLTLNLPEVEAVARMMPPRHISNQPVITLRRENVLGDEIAYWADPDIFDVMPLPVFRGDLKNALRRPDGMVLSRAVARKYFGRDDVVGETILADGHPMIVRAVVEDFPENATAFNGGGVFASGLAAFSPLRSDFSRDMTPVVTYFRLRPGASLAGLQNLWSAAIDKRFQQQREYGPGYSLQPMRLDRLAFLDPGIQPRLVAAALTGILILLVAAINFVNLLTARATQRAGEVGVRKACGAGRAALIVQFLGEAILTVLFATCVGLAVSEWVAPWINAFLGTGATLAELQTPAGLAVLLAFVILLGLAAGAWPALILSGLRPASVLKGLLPQGSGGEIVRKGLVILQFAILIGLAVAAAVIYQQDRFGAHDSLSGNIQNMLVIRGGCKAALRAELRKLPGVAGADCTDITFLGGSDLGGVTFRGKRFFDMTYVSADPGLFALYGIAPLAGSLPSASSTREDSPRGPTRIILNAAAVKRLGITSPEAAIGQSLTGFTAGQRKNSPSAPIIAVVPDFTFHTLTNEAIAPTIYTSGLNPFGDDDDMISVKLRSGHDAGTLAAIDRVWRTANPQLPVSRFFVPDYMEDMYQGLMRQALLFAVFCGVAIVLACLGLLGLSLSAAERRTKEIGVRKAMGADNRQIVAMLLWQFAQPVLWANVIAWPVAWWLMRRWLSRYAYHVELHWWVFAGASAAALAIALLTVAGQAWLTARRKPVLALRYE